MATLHRKLCVLLGCLGLILDASKANTSIAPRRFKPPQSPTWSTPQATNNKPGSFNPLTSQTLPSLHTSQSPTILQPNFPLNPPNILAVDHVGSDGSIPISYSSSSSSLGSSQTNTIVTQTGPEAEPVYILQSSQANSNEPVHNHPNVVEPHKPSLTSESYVPLQPQPVPSKPDYEIGNQHQPVHSAAYPSPSSTSEFVNWSTDSPVPLKPDQNENLSENVPIGATYSVNEHQLEQVSLSNQNTFNEDSYLGLGNNYEHGPQPDNSENVFQLNDKPQVHGAIINEDLEYLGNIYDNGIQEEIEMSHNGISLPSNVDTTNDNDVQTYNFISGDINNHPINTATLDQSIGPHTAFSDHIIDSNELVSNEEMSLEFEAPNEDILSVNPVSSPVVGHSSGVVIEPNVVFNPDASSNGNDDTSNPPPEQDTGDSSEVLGPEVDELLPQSQTPTLLETSISLPIPSGDSENVDVSESSEQAPQQEILVEIETSNLDTLSTNIVPINANPTEEINEPTAVLHPDMSNEDTPQESVGQDIEVVDEMVTQEVGPPVDDLHPQPQTPMLPVALDILMPNPTVEVTTSLENEEHSPLVEASHNTPETSVLENTEETDIIPNIMESLQIITSAAEVENAPDTSFEDVVISLVSPNKPQQGTTGTSSVPGTLQQPPLIISNEKPPLPIPGATVESTSSNTYTTTGTLSHIHGTSASVGQSQSQLAEQTSSQPEESTLSTSEECDQNYDDVDLEEEDKYPPFNVEQYLAQAALYLNGGSAVGSTSPAQPPPDLNNVILISNVNPNGMVSPPTNPAEQLLAENLQLPIAGTETLNVEMENTVTGESDSIPNGEPVVTQLESDGQHPEPVSVDGIVADNSVVNPLDLVPTIEFEQVAIDDLEPVPSVDQEIAPSSDIIVPSTVSTSAEIPPIVDLISSDSIETQEESKPSASEEIPLAVDALPINNEEIQQIIAPIVEEMPQMSELSPPAEVEVLPSAVENVSPIVELISPDVEEAILVENGEMAAVDQAQLEEIVFPTASNSETLETEMVPSNEDSIPTSENLVESNVEVEPQFQAETIPESEVTLVTQDAFQAEDILHPVAEISPGIVEDTSVTVEGIPPIAEISSPGDDATNPIVEITSVVEDAIIPAPEISSSGNEGAIIPIVEIPSFGDADATIPIAEISSSGDADATIPIAEISSSEDGATIPIEEITSSVEDATIPIAEITSFVPDAIIPVPEISSGEDVVAPIAETTSSGDYDSTIPIAEQSVTGEEAVFPIVDITSSGDVMIPIAEIPSPEGEGVVISNAEISSHVGESLIPTAETEMLPPPSSESVVFLDNTLPPVIIDVSTPSIEVGESSNEIYAPAEAETSQSIEFEIQTDVESSSNPFFPQHEILQPSSEIADESNDENSNSGVEITSSNVEVEPSIDETFPSIGEPTAGSNPPAEDNKPSLPASHSPSQNNHHSTNNNLPSTGGTNSPSSQHNSPSEHDPLSPLGNPSQDENHIPQHNVPAEHGHQSSSQLSNPSQQDASSHDSHSEHDNHSPTSQLSNPSQHENPSPSSQHNSSSEHGHHSPSPQLSSPIQQDAFSHDGHSEHDNHSPSSQLSNPSQHENPSTSSQHNSSSEHGHHSPSPQLSSPTQQDASSQHYGHSEHDNHSPSSQLSNPSQHEIHSSSSQHNGSSEHGHFSSNNPSQHDNYSSQHDGSSEDDFLSFTLQPSNPSQPEEDFLSLQISNPSQYDNHSPSSLYTSHSQVSHWSTSQNIASSPETFGLVHENDGNILPSPTIVSSVTHLVQIDSGMVPLGSEMVPAAGQVVQIVPQIVQLSPEAAYSASNTTLLFETPIFPQAIKPEHLVPPQSTLPIKPTSNIFSNTGGLPHYSAAGNSQSQQSNNGILLANQELSKPQGLSASKPIVKPQITGSLTIPNNAQPVLSASSPITTNIESSSTFPTGSNQFQPFTSPTTFESVQTASQLVLTPPSRPVLNLGDTPKHQLEHRARPRPVLGNRPSVLGINPAMYTYSGGKLNTGEDHSILHGSTASLLSNNQNGTVSVQEMGKYPQNSVVSVLSNTVYNSYMEQIQKRPNANESHPQYASIVSSQPFSQPSKTFSNSMTFSNNDEIGATNANTTENNNSQITSQNMYANYYFPQDSVKNATIYISNGIPRHPITVPVYLPTEQSLIPQLESDIKSLGGLEVINEGDSYAALLDSQNDAKWTAGITNNVRRTTGGRSTDPSSMQPSLNAFAPAEFTGAVEQVGFINKPNGNIDSQEIINQQGTDQYNAPTVAQTNTDFPIQSEIPSDEGLNFEKPVPVQPTEEKVSTVEPPPVSAPPKAPKPKDQGPPGLELPTIPGAPSPVNLPTFPDAMTVPSMQGLTLPTVPSMINAPEPPQSITGLLNVVNLPNVPNPAEGSGFAGMLPPAPPKPIQNTSPKRPMGNTGPVSQPPSSYQNAPINNVHQQSSQNVQESHHYSGEKQFISKEVLEDIMEMSDKDKTDILNTINPYEMVNDKDKAKVDYTDKAGSEKGRPNQYDAPAKTDPCPCSNSNKNPNKYTSPVVELDYDDNSSSGSKPLRPTKPKRPSRPPPQMGSKKPRPKPMDKDLDIGPENSAEKQTSPKLSAADMAISPDHKGISNEIDDDSEIDTEDDDNEESLTGKQADPAIVDMNGNSQPINTDDEPFNVNFFGWEIPVPSWTRFTNLFLSLFGNKFRTISGEFTCDETDDEFPVLRTELVVDYLCGDDYSRGDMAAIDSNICNMFCNSNGFFSGACLPQKQCLCYMNEDKNFAIKLELHQHYNQTEEKIPGQLGFEDSAESSCQNCRCLKSCKNHGKYVGYCSKSCHCGVPWYNEFAKEVPATKRRL